MRIPAEPVSVGQVNAILGFGIVQRVVKPRDRANGVTKRWMRGDIRDAFAVDINLTPIAQAFDIFGAGEGTAFVGDEILRAHVVLRAGAVSATTLAAET